MDHQNNPGSPLDEKMMQYWPLLTREQKETILTIIQSFTRPDGHYHTDKYSEELKQALQRVKAGEYYTHQQIKEILKKIK
ncbi:hypothetical protein LZZ85_06235 [Terrimonas sp. NA20]|uniref:Uncharacterized protein n=1 Tax=Terrimonas ginsenosidimutans TaxID=2908004 RepID=A0ABS9KNK5_9BACT|nr:hypothetical protein [Terrimonas ginsenosidimutans]MCG2613869.1 hypothetical protein [Terrimonas ginsenosidimutans]